MPELSFKAYLETEVALPIHAHLLLDNDTDGALLLESLTEDGDLNAFRSQPHTSRLYLAVLAPQVDVIAVVTVDSITGDVFPQTIEYTLVSGDDTLVRSGMTAWVGTAAHDDSLGRVRARATPGAGFLYLAENSDIDWSVGAYITFYNEYLPWPRYPYVQADGTIFKDYAINYFAPPNQQTVLWPPVAMMGSCGVGVMHGGVAYVLFDGGESYATAPGAVIDTFDWVFPDGTPSTSTDLAPGWVAFSTQGVKQVELTVTDTNGIATISRRAILIVDLDAPLYPYYAYTDFGVESWEGDTDTGWGTKLRVFGTSDRTYFSERAVVMLYAEETYGGEAAGEAIAGPFAGGTFATDLDILTSLIAWWKLEEASGTRVDSVGGNNLTDNNTVTSAVGVVGNAASFAKASNESLSIPDNIALSTGDIDFMCTYWVKQTSKTSEMVHVGKYTTTGNQREWLVEYSVATDRFIFIVSSNGTAFTLHTASSLGSPVNGTWYFVAVWHDAVNNTLNIQVNNGTVDSVAYSGGVFNSTSSFRIGDRNAGSALPFDGQIDEVRFYKRILTAAERQLLYLSPSGVDRVWVTPANAATLNQVYTTATLINGEHTPWLIVTNCGFAIPTQGTIRGVRVRITGHASVNSALADSLVSLFVAGAPVGTDQATVDYFTTSDSTREYGGENNTWGLTLVPAVVNLTTFGVGIQVIAGANGTMYIDYVDITVWYNTGATLGFETYRSNVKHMGYILDDSITVDPQTNEVSFETGSISRVAEKLYGFPTIVQDKAEPATWSEGYALTMRRATLYLLYWHTTFVQIADVMIEDDSTPVQIADFPKSSLWDMLRNWIASTRIGHAYVTKNGRVTVARDAQIMTLAERNALDVVMQLQSNDWREEVEISESVLSSLAFLDWSGVWYEGNPDVAPIPLFSKAPGDAPKVYGRDEAVQYLVLDSQITSNTLAGLYLAWKNNVSNLVRVSMAGNWVSAFDPGYVEYVQAPVGGFVTKRGTLLADARLIVRSMSIDADTANGVLLPTLVLEAESSTLHNQGETGDYPPGAIPAQAAACPMGMVWDTEARECVITYPAENPYPWQDTWRSNVYVATNTLGVFFSDNFTGPDGAMPTWKSVNKGLSTSGALSCWQMVSDPYNPSLLYYITANNGTNSVLYKWDVAAQEWNALHDAKTLAAAIGIPSGGVLLDVCYITTLMVSASRPAGYLAIIITNADNPNYTTWFSESSDYGANFSTAVKIDVSGGASWAQGMQQRGTMGQFAGTSGDPAGDVLYIPLQKRLGVGTSKMWESVDGGAAFTAPGYTNPTYDFEAGTLVVDPSSQDCAWYIQDAIKKFTGTMGAVSTKLAGVGSAYKNALDVFLNPSGSPALIVRAYDALDAGNKRRIYKTVDGGAVWSSQDDSGSDMTDAGFPYGLTVLSDSDNKIYVMASASPGVGGHHIGVSDDDGALVVGKSGSAAGIADPGDGTGIPYSAGGIVDIAVVWNTK